MSATATEAASRNAVDHYQLDSGRREIVTVFGPGDDAEVIDQVLDCPAEGDGRVYVIGSELRIDELDALLADYKEQAEDLGFCPMSREALSEKLARGIRQEEAIS
jgi:hypothetical protein